MLHNFGSGVDVSGTQAVVGARSATSDGSVYVFTKSGGSWSEVTRIDSPVPTAGFGDDVDLGGSRLIVGAPFASTFAGAAMIYVGSGPSWTLEATFFGGPNSFMGTSVATDGGTSAVGAIKGGPGTTGVVTVYERNPSWGLTQTILPPGGQANDNFGSAVALSGNTLLVGANMDNSGGTSSGQAFVYTRTGFGSPFTLQQTLLASDAGVGHFFGIDVALEGNRAVIGAPNAGGFTSGQAYAFVRNGATWSQEAILVPGDASFDDDFGSAVSLRGDVVLIGSPKDDDQGLDSGSAYRFQRAGPGAWFEAGKMSEPTGGADDRFGNDVALDGEDNFVASIWDDDNGFDSGSAFVFTFAGAAYGFCTAGVCGNADPTAGCANSSGSGARLVGCGSSSVSADDLYLVTSNTVPGQAGIFFMGPSTASFTVGDGIFVVGGPFHRYPVQFPVAGTMTEGPGIVGFTQANFPPGGQIQSGQTWYFQTWYRDPAGPCATGTNVSNGYAVTFTP